MAYIYHGIELTLKRSEILTHATTWMNLADIMQIEIRQLQKNKYCVITLI